MFQDQPTSLVKKPTNVAKPFKICNVANKPVLSQSVEKQVHQAVAQYLNSSVWYEWGMKNFRKQGSCILMQGPPGCGKTLTARYLTQLIKRPLSILDMGTFGSGTPGENERNLANFFAEAENKKSTIFLDECEAILWDRSKAGSDSMWMLPIIDKLLTEIADYRHLCILATNREELLDSALKRRLIATITISRPDYMARELLWRQKIPSKFPLQLTTIQCQALANIDLSGAQIETVIIKETQLAIIEGRLPNFDSICNVAKEEAI